MSKPDADDLYKQGHYAAAAVSYTELLEQTKEASTRSIILSNRAACALALDDTAGAESDCRAGLTLNPVSAKLRYRLAQALWQQGQDGAAACQIAAAVALLQPAAPTAEMLQLYQQVAAATAVAATPTQEQPADAPAAAADPYPGLQLPADPRAVVFVSTAQELMGAATGRAAFIVAAPGSYQLPMPLDGSAQPAGLTVMGLGRVTLSCRTTHAAWVRRGCLTLVNAQLVGSGAGAAACVSEESAGFPGMMMRRSTSSASSAAGPICRMFSCRVESYPEVGLLVCEGAAVLQGCSFSRCKLHAIEVREGGSLWASETVIDSCKQGVAAYGGAKHVQLHRCSISNTAKEGVLAAGSYENAATVAQRQFQNPRRYISVAAKQATEEAEAWGKQHGQQLTLVMSDCSLQGCGNFGVSVDEGAAARISRCRLEACDPFCVFVKGSSDACITACQFIYSGRSAKSLWAQKLYGGQAVQASGEPFGVF